MGKSYWPSKHETVIWYASNMPDGTPKSKNADNIRPQPFCDIANVNAAIYGNEEMWSLDPDANNVPGGWNIYNNGLRWANN